MGARVNFYAGSGLDRVSHLRADEAWIAARLGDPRSRVVALWRDHNLFVAPSAPGEPLLPALPSVAELGRPVTALLRNGKDAIGAAVAFLGLEEDAAYFAVDLSAIADPSQASGLFGGGEFADLRRQGPLLGRREAAILAYARGLMYWHARHRFCGVCGAPTKSFEAGHQRRCGDPTCGAVAFPRTDPVVIMLVSDGERCLLGRQAAWPRGFHSALAGFVEPGESLEEAVAREVFEETGVRVREVRYHSSQPWPFPGSLMLGFHAEAATTELKVNRDELEDARWFDRAGLIASTEDDAFRLPPRVAIARRLIESWLGRE